MAQNTVQYEGRVITEDGEPIIGANITLTDGKAVGVSDIDGNFTFTGPNKCNFKVSYVGYGIQEITAIAGQKMTVVLKELANNLNELVVVGYGVQKKSDLTSAISTIKADDIEATSVTSFDQGIQGRAAGIAVLNTSGQPGGGTSIRIRGTSSINGNNEPLYVIDGMPIISDAGSLSTGTLKGPGLNPLTNINPGDIQSIEILKDASATAIYGARGANGVVLVTTKQGKLGKAKLSVGVKLSFQRIAKKMKLLNALQLAQLANEAADNDGVERRPIFAGLNNLAKDNTDWQDQIFRTAPMQSYDFSLSGASEKMNYYVSGNIVNQDGIIIASNFKKGSFRVNLNADMNKWLKVGITSNSSYEKSNGVVTNSEGAFASSITSWALEMNPALPVRDASGTYTYENNLGSPNVGNPVEDAYRSKNKTTAFRTLNNMYLQWTPIKNLVFKTSLGADYSYIKEQAFAPADIKRAESNEGYASIGNRDTYSWVWENTVNYMFDIYDKHHFTVLGGLTAQKFHSEMSAVATADFSDGTLGYHSIQSGAEKQMATSGISEWQMLSYLARVNYNYDNKYLLTASARIDGSSKFGKGNKYGFFPSISGAWRMSEENFLKNNPTISNMKLRISYGEVGNEGIMPYSSQGLLYDTEAYFGNNTIVKGKAPYTISNQDLKWETTAQYDAGFDLGLFNNRVNLSFDVYLKKTRDLLLSTPISYQTGYDVIMKNIGSLENKGFDITLNLVPFDRKFTWTSDLTYGYNKNKITSLAGSTENLNGASILGITYWTKITEGEPIGVIYGYKTDGIVQSNEDPSKIPFFAGKTLYIGDRKYKEKSIDGIINEEDLYVLGDANPDFTYGWNNTFGYKFNDGSKLSLTLYLQGAVGNQIVNFNKFALESFNGYKNNTIAALNRWTPENPSNVYPRATMKSAGTILSDHYVEDGTYMRIKDITLTYAFPRKLLQPFLCEGLTIYASLKNFYTFTDYSGYDPEVSRFANDNLSMGADYGSYPMSKSFEFGLKVNF
ncbi:TonB-linked outer membrane protein, SusC/RagA family [Prevotella sp. KH2C16]|nr:TonB-linked outer membrane protein, SusC/RagA family [Prevotella sp. KH2C16]